MCDVCRDGVCVVCIRRQRVCVDERVCMCNVCVCMFVCVLESYRRLHRQRLNEQSFGACELLGREVI